MNGHDYEKRPSNKSEAGATIAKLINVISNVSSANKLHAEDFMKPGQAKITQTSAPPQQSNALTATARNRQDANSPMSSALSGALSLCQSLSEKLHGLQGSVTAEDLKAIHTAVSGLHQKIHTAIEERDFM